MPALPGIPGERRNGRNADPGRRAEFLLRTLPWANICCPFRALEGRSGVLPLLIQKCPISRETTKVVTTSLLYTPQLILSQLPGEVRRERIDEQARDDLTTALRADS